MTITALPTPPSRQDPLNFADRADDFLGALPQFATEANALATAVNADETAAAASAADAANSADIAQAAALAAQTVSSYKGEWSSLTGPLTVPSTVSYLGIFYTLTSNIADVTAHTPGVSAVWLVVGTGERPLSISTNTSLNLFTTYRVTANCIATLPAAPTDGSWVKFINKTGTNNFTVARNGKTIEGLSADLTVNVNNKGFWMIYSATANDWWIFV